MTGDETIKTQKKKRKLIVEKVKNKSKPRSRVQALSALATSIDRNIDFTKKRLDLHLERCEKKYHNEYPKSKAETETQREHEFLQHEFKIAQVFAH